MTDPHPVERNSIDVESGGSSHQKLLSCKKLPHIHGIAPLFVVLCHKSFTKLSLSEIPTEMSTTDDVLQHTKPVNTTQHPCTLRSPYIGPEASLTCCNELTQGRGLLESDHQIHDRNIWRQRAMPVSSPFSSATTLAASVEERRNDVLKGTPAAAPVLAATTGPFNC